MSITLAWLSACGQPKEYHGIEISIQGQDIQTQLPKKICAIINAQWIVEYTRWFSNLPVSSKIVRNETPFQQIDANPIWETGSSNLRASVSWDTRYTEISDPSGAMIMRIVRDTKKWVNVIVLQNNTKRLEAISRCSLGDD